MNPSKKFQEYLVNVDDIFFDTWDRIVCDAEEYFTVWPWMKKWMINKMDEILLKDGCQTYENSWMRHNKNGARCKRLTL